MLVLGDQLNHDAAVFDGFDNAHDTVLMAEVAEESTHVPSHAQRTVLFLSAMRHFADSLRAQGRRVRYVALDDPKNTQSLASEFARAVRELRPSRVCVVKPGEHRIRAIMNADVLGAPVEILPDRHFLTGEQEFRDWAGDRKRPVMEHFYRQQRRRLGVLMRGDEPEGGVWNYDKDNRLPFTSKGPSPRPKPQLRFQPDEITLKVVRAVAAKLPKLPGRVDDFGWPVTREQALLALDDFITNRLPMFGPYEDAMWEKEPWLYHSGLSAALNLKLLNPRECVRAAEAAYRERKAPLQSVEAFIRQIIGWREFIRGVYDLEGPGYGARNSLDAHGSLPEMYWSGQTDMNCLRACIGQVLEHGYAHHIQRLMVLSNFALTSGVHPRALSDWFLGMFVDGVDWATLPNTLGMAMHADGDADRSSVVGTKPYASSGAYIKRMSNYCKGCRYDPAKRDGPDACPFTLFYWDFLSRHRDRFASNPRMATIIRNLDRFGERSVAQLTISAAKTRIALGIAPGKTQHPADGEQADNAPLATLHTRPSSKTAPAQAGLFHDPTNATPPGPRRARKPA